MMKKKVLFCATVDFHFKAFHLPFMKWFQEQGWEVHVAASGNIKLPFTDQKYNLPIQRSPFSVKNIGAYKKLKRIIDKNEYDIIHCHTPVGGVLARLAAMGARKKGAKVFYTAHGFHFCKGAPFINWLLYYPIERGLSTITDCLITINKEDYYRAVRHHFSAKKIEHVHGVGVDIERFKPIDEISKKKLREKLGYQNKDFLMFYAAMFNKNKNQQMLIKALSRIKDQVPGARLLLAGEGPLLDDCKKLAQDLGVAKMVDFLGFRKDLEDIIPICDIAVASSLREGLPVNIMEAMACSLPVVGVENRGHKELVQNNVNGWIIGHEDIDSMADKIKELAQNEALKITLGKSGRKIVENSYSIQKVQKELTKIYFTKMNELEGKEWKIS
ncbi:glycosyltransferase family 4 protein [Neobacillus drentensis]|uniref:glycosyltransferase family 4 protein n=1 Tax=Neobacillus drentensis TaxID=220684 RepID=UPI003003589F